MAGLLPYLDFPTNASCQATPGLYLDTPRWFPNDRRLEVIAACFPDPDVLQWITIEDIDVDVRIDHLGGLYAGIIVKTVRTDKWLLCNVHSRITIYHPYGSFWRVQPSRIPYLQPALTRLQGELLQVVNAAKRDNVWAIQVHRNPNFDVGFKKDTTVVCELWRHPHHFYVTFDRMRAMVIAAVQQGGPPTFPYHLRIWGAELIGRAPSGALGMGFWENRCRWPHRPGAPWLYSQESTSTVMEEDGATSGAIAE